MSRDAEDTGNEVNQATGMDMKASKMRTECSKLAQASYKCLEQNPGNNSACQQYFDVYKECRKNEHTRIVEDRRKKFT